MREIGSADTDDGPSPCLDAPHRRPTRYVFERAVSLPACEEPEERELGARILRELGPPDAEGRRPFAGETIDAVVVELPSEPDPGVLGWMISVLGHHGATATLDLVLDHRAHPARAVRFAVAAALPCPADPDRTRQRVVEALLRLAEDEDGAVRWYALCALFHETVAVTDERKALWAPALHERGDTERRARLRRLGASLGDDAPPALRRALRRALHRPPLR
ncbi:hypothetical protein ACIRP0_28235 [Streptomyces sp. NPDC101733]|uniref:hypothetical protein n=1 Tax=unclassified Streptomyces TaxID=2593676 RepID=UPI00382F3F7F